MRTFFIFAASALLLAAVIVELSTRLWPGNSMALLLLSFVTLLAQGYLSLRLAPARPGPDTTAGTAPERGRTGGRGRGRDSGGESRRDSARASARAPAKTRDAENAGAGETAAAGPRETGTVKWFNRTKGFGFIIRESGEEIFVHQRSIRSEGTGENRRRPSLRDGQPVSFVVAEREKGKQAEDVTPN